jgi:hypothetical protein
MQTSSEIKVGSMVNCPDGLGKVKEIKDGKATVFIHTFGSRQYDIASLKLRS